LIKERTPALFDVDVMMIGCFTKDKIVVDGKGKIASGGAVYYGSIALRHAGVSVAIVTRVHPDDFPRLDELREAGVEVFATPAQQTSSIVNLYDSADMEQRICKLLGFAGPFQPQDIPDMRAQIYSLSPVIAGEVDLLLLKSLIC
jgi:sugar/nucleoside kinase (ribokinase family)